MDNQHSGKQKSEEAIKTSSAKKKSGKKKWTDNAFFNKVKELWHRLAETAFGKRAGAHFQKHGYLYFSFFIPSLLFFFVFILQRTYPFGNSSVLVLDLNGQYVYFFEALRRAIYGDASLLYSWSGTLGNEFIGNYAYYLASPLSYLVALFPKHAMTEFLLFLELLKCGLCGLTMALYLRKTRPLANEMITISIAIMYALSAYAIVMAHNTMWIDALILLPLIVFGIERLVLYGHFKLFICSFAVALMSNFYIGYMLCFFVFIYFFYYYIFASHRKSTQCVIVDEGGNNFINERFHFGKSFLRIAGASVIALLIACAIILPTYYSLTLGKTTFSTTDWNFVLFETPESDNLFFKFTPIDFISKLFIGSYDSVRRSGFPFIYCGMFTLILVPVYFISKRVTLRQKIGAAAILTVLFLLMIVSPLDLIMHGFQEPNWLNYRYSFVFSFMMLVFAHRGLELLHTVKFKKTVIVASVWVALVTVCSFFTKTRLFIEADDNEEFIRRLVVFILAPIVCLVVYEILHYLLLQDRLRAAARNSLISTAAVIICIEMFAGTLLNTVELNDDVTFSPKYTAANGKGLEGYNNYIEKYRPLFEAIQASDDSFYRMEKDNVRKYADNHAFGLRGTTGSTSTLNAKTIKFLQRIGYLSQSNISSNKGATSVGNTLLGIRYYVTTSNGNEAATDYYLTPYPVLIEGSDTSSYEYNYAEGKSLYAYLNEYALSIAYASSADIKDYNITENTSPFTTMNKLITAILGEEETVEVFKEIAYRFDYDATAVTYSSSSYSETLYDIYGEPIPKLDSDGNILYDTDGNELYQKTTTKYHTFTKKAADSESDEKMVITFTITMPDDVDENTEVFFKIPTKYSRKCSWTFTTENSTETKKGTCFVDEDKTNCILSLGTMAPGETGTFVLTVTGDATDGKNDQLYIDRDEGNGIFYYVDEDLYTDVMTRLAEGNFAIEEYTESSFKGSITASENATSVFTTIPYDKYWVVTVDGEEVETYMTCAALLGFDLGSEGTHRVTITYRSEPLNKGIILSVAGVTLLVLWTTLDVLIFRKKRLAKATLDYTVFSEGDYQSDEYDEECREKVEKMHRRQEYLESKRKKK